MLQNYEINKRMTHVHAIIYFKYVYFEISR